jgi:hypothetical protein
LQLVQSNILSNNTYFQFEGHYEITGDVFGIENLNLQDNNIQWKVNGDEPNYTLVYSASKHDAIMTFPNIFNQYHIKYISDNSFSLFDENGFDYDIVEIQMDKTGHNTPRGFQVSKPTDNYYSYN